MSRIFNFSAGPAMLAEEVLRQAREEMLDWRGSGMSVMEMSHRGPEYMEIQAQAEQDLRELLAIPPNYKVLFMQGGASIQFAALPLNLAGAGVSADYVSTGEWSKKAIKEAKKFCKVNVAASSEDRNFSYFPKRDAWQLTENAGYVHICTNETIGGVELHWTPDTGRAPLVADMSSHFLSRPVDVSRFAVIYAGAQKNVGPAGLCVVIIREDLMGRAAASTPTMLDYKTQAENDSMYNTPPTYSVYIAGLTLQWIKRKGGLAAMEQDNIAKAKLLYDLIDSGDFYASPVVVEDRSRMNVPFTLRDAALDEAFLKEAKSRGLIQLKGHRSVGGMRASIYNAMPPEGVRVLTEFMRDFARRHG
jgi:phosphoserine aminotransferase